MDYFVVSTDTNASVIDSRTGVTALSERATVELCVSLSVERVPSSLFYKTQRLNRHSRRILQTIFFPR